MLLVKTLPGLFYKAGCNTINHDGIEHAGYLAFLGLLAMFPFLVFVVALAGFMGEGQAGNHFINLILTQFPADMVAALKPRLAEIMSGPPQGLLTVSILGALWTSSSEVEGYRTVLNRAYGVTTPPSYLLRRLLSIFQTLVLSFILLLFMIIVVVAPMVLENMTFLHHRHQDASVGDQIAYVSVAVIFIVVSAAYYFLPNIRQSIVTVAPGAAIATMLLIIAAKLLALYISQFNQVNLIYGSLGGIIAALLFFYIGNIIFIYGAELNHLIKLSLGETIEQKR